MATIDITNLTGNDLFEALKSGAKIKTDKNKAPTPVPSLWRNKALVLIIHQTTCTCCSHQYSVPNPHILLHRQHPTEGDHFTQVTPTYKDPEAVFTGLPLIEKVEMSTVKACQFCWNLGSVIEQARATDEQVEKPQRQTSSRDTGHEQASAPVPTVAPEVETQTEDFPDTPEEDLMADLRDSGLLGTSV